MLAAFTIPTYQKLIRSKQRKTNIKSYQFIIEWQNNRKKEIVKSQSELDTIFGAKVRSRGYSTSNWKPYMTQNEAEEYEYRSGLLSEDKNTELATELKQLQHNLEKIKTLKLAEIISRDNINQIFSLTTENEIGELISFNDVKTNNYFMLVIIEKPKVAAGYIALPIIAAN